MLRNGVTMERREIMPPAAKISKQEILEVAFKILKDENLMAITARRLAKELNCSTHPIYQCFKNMDDLYDDLHTMAAQYFRSVVEKNMKASNYPWLELGVSYVQMAYREKNIYRFLYVEQTRPISDIEEYIGNSDGKRFTTELANNESWKQRSNEDKEELHLMIRIFTQGLASIANNCEKELDEGQIRRLLERSFEVF